MAIKSRYSAGNVTPTLDSNAAISDSVAGIPFEDQSQANRDGRSLIFMMIEAYYLATTASIKLSQVSTRILLSLSFLVKERPEVTCGIRVRGKIQALHCAIEKGFK